MSVLQVLFSADILLALTFYGLAIILAIPCFDKIHAALGHSVLQWPWDHIAMPLLRACLMLLFILIAYPGIFAINEAPALLELLAMKEGRVNQLVNLLFLLTLFLPLIPVIGDWEELVLPVQAIAACCLLFSWLAAELGIDAIHYWPGLDSVVYILILAFITHWMAVTLSHIAGGTMDDKFNVTGSEQLVSRVLVLLMQSPAILLFSLALGRQLN